MNPTLTIRDETPADIETITAVTVAAFQTLDISHHTEHLIVLALRAAHALTVSLEAFFALAFDGRILRGTMTFHEAFKLDSPTEEADAARV